MAIARDNTLQHQFLQRIKDSLPKTVSFVDELAETLEISNDSAYRRIRGETALNIDEIALLCTHYKVSFDVFSQNTPQVTFQYNAFNEFNDFRSYLKSIRDDLEQISKSENKEIVYAALDIPIFRYFNHPLLAAFKLFYWMKIILNVEQYKYQKFEISIVSDELKSLSSDIYYLYSSVPSTEIWTIETINGFLKQIEYCWEAGIFQTIDDAIEVCNQLKDAIKHLELQCEHGFKTEERTKRQTPFFMYQAEIEFSNNCILISKGDIRYTYLSILTFNKMITTNTLFSEETSRWFQNLIKKSTLISGTGEKQRYRFFKTIYTKIDSLYAKIQDTK